MSYSAHVTQVQPFSKVRRKVFLKSRRRTFVVCIEGLSFGWARMRVHLTLKRFGTLATHVWHSMAKALGFFTFDKGCSFRNICFCDDKSQTCKAGTSTPCIPVKILFCNADKHSPCHSDNFQPLTTAAIFGTLRFKLYIFTSLSYLQSLKGSKRKYKSDKLSSLRGQYRHLAQPGGLEITTPQYVNEIQNVSQRHVKANFHTSMGMLSFTWRLHKRQYKLDNVSKYYTDFINAINFFKNLKQAAERQSPVKHVWQYLEVIRLRKRHCNSMFARLRREIKELS